MSEMSETTEIAEVAENQESAATVAAKGAVEDKEEISYHAVEKNGTITAIWEMRGRRHVRTIDPRSVEGRHLLRTPESSEAAAG